MSLFKKASVVKTILALCVILILGIQAINKVNKYYRYGKFDFLKISTNAPYIVSEGFENHVTATLTGRLGNQMFVYATAYALGQKLHKPVAIAKRYCDRTYDLGVFNIPQEFNDVQKIWSIRSWFTPAEKKASLWDQNWFYYDDSIWSIPASQKNTVIKGHVQSPVYFEEFQDDLRNKVFVLNKELSVIAQGWKRKINAAKISVSLHVRRGDYLNFTIFNGPDIHYYKRAVRLMMDLFGDDIEFFIFSDDFDYIKENFSWIKKAHYVNSDSRYPYEDMTLMSECHHNIIANSSYSWWGAYLNKNKKKKVIAPMHWFSKEYQLYKCPTIDLYPKDWILLK